MRTILYPLTFFGFFVLTSCQKELSFQASNTNEVASIQTRYLALGTWDDSGKPNYLLTKDVISPSLEAFVTSTLPEHSNLTLSHPELFGPTASADIAISRTSDVFISYVFETTIMSNTIAFYTYPTGKPPLKTTDIKSLTYIFPNAGDGSTLEGGDKVKIGRISAGTSVGFALLQGGWNRATKELENKVEHFYSTDVLNPEPNSSLKKHVIAIEYVPENKVLIGFEDLERTRNDCDHDFNDVMFYVTLTQ